MKSYNVIISIPVEVDLVIEAASKEEAESEARREANDLDFQGLLNMSDSYATGEPEVVESWELDDDEEDEDDEVD